MIAIVSFFRTCRALAIGNSLRVTTCSLTPPKLIVAIVQKLIFYTLSLRLHFFVRARSHDEHLNTATTERGWDSRAPWWPGVLMTFAALRLCRCGSIR